MTFLRPDPDDADRVVLFGWSWPRLSWDMIRRAPVRCEKCGHARWRKLETEYRCLACGHWRPR